MIPALGAVWGVVSGVAKSRFGKPLLYLILALGLYFWAHSWYSGQLESSYKQGYSAAVIAAAKAQEKKIQEDQKKLVPERNRIEKEKDKIADVIIKTIKEIQYVQTPGCTDLGSDATSVLNDAINAGNGTLPVQ